MAPTFLDTNNLPFCRGCSHHMIARNIQKALETLDVDLLDVILVTDIGCHGIIDKNFHTHTVHGLHGRSAALGAGIAAALSDPAKKVIVLIGDGGATIGLNHLISAARSNFNMTVVVHNNMLYGMTGGQPSDLTPPGFNTRSTMTGVSDHSLDIYSLVKTAGAAYVSRIAAMGDFSEPLADAFRNDGFSLIEILEICPSYGVKFNKGITIKDLEKRFGLPLGTYKNNDAKPMVTTPKTDIPSLFDSLEVVPTSYEHRLKQDLTLVIGGSAGEGVQSAAEIFAKAAMACGLKVTRKGSYPVTVGIGFSAVEINLSTQPIDFTGSRSIHWAVISSRDGLAYLKKRIETMNSGYLLLDDQLPPPSTAAAVLKVNFRQRVGGKESVLLALLTMLNYADIFPAEAFIQALTRDKIAEKIDIQRLKDSAAQIASNNFSAPTAETRN
jgi:2-oxoglutarate ferredoxin oxidoreductase subunit beta